MKYILLTIAMIFIAFPAYSAPYRCDMAGGVIFSDKALCDASCAGETGQKSCEELSPLSSGAGVCDNERYRGFATVNGKTYALTNAPVSWSAEKTAKIRDANDNKVITKLLSKLGVSEAWIGADDKKRSTAYNSIDKERFTWRDGTKLSYSNWRSGEPNNTFDASAIGVAPIYGEHWVAMDSNGTWRDLGYNTDGSERKLPAVVEFNGTLSCVNGKEKEPSSADSVAGIVCAGGTDANGMVQLNKCQPGIIFDTADTGYLCSEGKTACIRDEKVTDSGEIKKTVTGNFKDAYIKGHDLGQFSSTTSSGWYLELYLPVSYGYNISLDSSGKINHNVKRQQEVGWLAAEAAGGTSTGFYLDKFDDFNSTEQPVPLSGTATVVSIELSVKVPIYDYNSATETWYIKSYETKTITKDQTLNIPDKEAYSSFLEYTYTIVYRNVQTKTTYTCPHSGRPCIESGGGYYCSPNDCLDSSNGSNYDKNENETPQGSGDADNNGETDEEGNCLGRLVIFPGNDKRCRMVGYQTKFIQCCKIVKPEDADKPDIILFPDMLDFDVCSGSERQLAVNRAKDQCVTIGKYCSEKWQGSGCVQKKETHCCFDSDFSRAFNEAGMDLLKKNWGTPENPNCGGFSPDELQILSAMGISDHPKMKEYADKLGAEFSNKLMKEFNKSFQTPEFKDKIEQQIEGAGK